MSIHLNPIGTVYADLGGFDLADVERPNLKDDADLSGEIKKVRQIDLAWGRSGDKGDKFNVGIIARKPEYYPYIRKALNEARVIDWFKHEFARDRDERPHITPNPRVERFEVRASIPSTSCATQPWAAAASLPCAWTN